MDLEQARSNMVKQQIRCCDVADEAVIAAFNTIPRENFVPKAYKKFAFADMSIPLEHDQLMMCPKEQAQLVQALALQADAHVLEIGTGSGYLTAILASIAKQVTSVDVYPDFTQQAQNRLQQLDLHNITLATGNAVNGWPSSSPYDAIMITGALLQLPQAFASLLKPGGRLVAILGQAPAMCAKQFILTQDGDWQVNTFFETCIPSLMGAREQSSFIF